MLSKIGWVLGIWVAITVVYIVMTAAMPGINTIVQTANSTINATSNLSNYPGLQDTIESSPLWLYVIPAAVGGIATVVVLKRK